MRLDKYLAQSGACIRSDVAKAVSDGRVAVNGAVCSRRDVSVCPEDTVTFDGIPVVYREHFYIMLNKPSGYVSTTLEEEGNSPSVMRLIPEAYRSRGLFPCGRLDKDTTGFLLITNDGGAAHRLLAPKKHVNKVYAFSCRLPLSEDDAGKLCGGVNIGDLVTMPAEITVTGSTSGYITIKEGKFHQIKRMFEAVGNGITSLERVEFGGVSLDRSLGAGEWRFLTSDEEKTLLGNI
ncbi:MAG: rRNA pseudouridine synthase [Clostridia bacterium]|nr:rRNA pseudouridine synthase [Clostridia bacterium]